MNKNKIATILAGIMFLLIIVITMFAAVISKKEKPIPQIHSRTMQKTSDKKLKIYGQAITKDQIRTAHIKHKSDYLAAYNGKEITVSMLGFCFAEITEDKFEVSLDNIFVPIFVDGKITGITWVFRKDGDISTKFVQDAKGFAVALKSDNDLVLFKNKDGSFATDKSGKIYSLLSNSKTDISPDLSKIISDYNVISKEKLMKSTITLDDAEKPEKTTVITEKQATLKSDKSGVHIDIIAITKIRMKCGRMNYIDVPNAYKDDVLKMISSLSLSEIFPEEKESLGVEVKFSYANNTFVNLNFRDDKMIRIIENGKKDILKIIRAIMMRQ